ncbi:MAG: helix-turn-helix domain-containing protein [Candidatus Pacearchaeota archaeon]
MVKIKKFPLKDEKYTKILVEMCRETYSIKELAKRIGLSDSSTTESLDKLEELGCIKRELSKKPYKHKKDVSIDWQSLTKQYLIYLTKEEDIKLSDNNIEFYSKNRYLQRLLKLLIAGHQKSVHNFREVKTIYQLFSQITIQMIYGDETFSNPTLKKLKKRDYSFSLFRDFIKKIKDKKTANNRKDFKKFLKKLIKNIEEERTSKKNN